MNILHAWGTQETALILTLAGLRSQTHAYPAAGGMLHASGINGSWQHFLRKWIWTECKCQGVLYILTFKYGLVNVCCLVWHTSHTCTHHHIHAHTSHMCTHITYIITHVHAHITHLHTSPHTCTHITHVHTSSHSYLGSSHKPVLLWVTRF